MSMLSEYLKERDDTAKRITKMADFFEKAFENYERKESKKVTKKLADMAKKATDLEVAEFIESDKVTDAEKVFLMLNR